MKNTKVLFCEFDFCIYNNQNECLLDGIRLSTEGICESCIMTNIDQETLDKSKQETRKKLFVH